VTKAMTAAAVMVLHEQGRLDLNAPVTRWLPKLAQLKVMGAAGAQSWRTLEREITIQHLLTHTAGFGYGFEPDDPLAEAYQAAGFFNQLSMLQMPLPELARRLADLPLADQPGERVRYSLAYDLLGYLIELVSNQPLGDFMRERLFSRLGMANTGFWVQPEQLDRLGPLYGRPNEAGLAVLDPAAGAFAKLDGIPSGGGGLVSTLTDTGRFFSMLVNRGEWAGERVLRPESAQAMLTSQVVGGGLDGPAPGYGVWVGLDGEPPESWPRQVFGVSGGYGTLALGCQPAGLVLVCLAQSFPNAQPGRHFAKLAFEALAA
jgi:CubicO group peptidase (beta-lactamase class C family)